MSGRGKNGGRIKKDWKAVCNFTEYTEAAQYRAEQLCQELQEKYGVTVLAVNCEQLKSEDIRQILQSVLYEFPLEALEFYIPKWVEMLRQRISETAAIQEAGKILQQADQMKDIVGHTFLPEHEEIAEIRLDVTDLASGTVKICLEWMNVLL